MWDEENLILVIYVCGVRVKGHVCVVCKMDYDSESDSSWLIQEPKIEGDGYNFDIVNSFMEEELVGDSQIVSWWRKMRR